MKLTLLLMRHAKSAFALDHFSDHERPLAPAGRQTVAGVAAQLGQMGIKPEIIYCSDALRTKQTLELLLPNLSAEPQMELTKSLYQVSLEDLIGFIKTKNPEHRTVQVIAHNPTLESLTQHLSGEFRAIEPGDIAILEHQSSSWQEALEQKGSWQLTNFISAT